MSMIYSLGIDITQVAAGAHFVFDTLTFAEVLTCPLSRSSASRDKLGCSYSPHWLQDPDTVCVMQCWRNDAQKLRESYAIRVNPFDTFAPTPSF